MALITLLSLLGFFLSSYVSATALTYKLAPNAKECFYAHVDNKGAKVAFYFAVCELIHCLSIASLMNVQVQSGGSFDGMLTQAPSSLRHEPLTPC